MFRKHERATEWTCKEMRVDDFARHSSDATLEVHVDSDWVGDSFGRKSTTGVIVRRG